MPATIAQPDVCDVSQEQASPGTVAWKPRAGFASELEGQRDFFPAFLVAQYDRADLTWPL
jgi:hypothetical protein